MSFDPNSFRIKNGRNYVLKIDRFATDVKKTASKESRHNLPEINFFLSGTAKYKIGDSIFDINGEEIFFVPPSVDHCLLGVDKRVEYINIWFDPCWIGGENVAVAEEYAHIFSCIKAGSHNHIGTFSENYLAIRDIITTIYDEAMSKKRGFEQMIKLQLACTSVLLSREFESALSDISLKSSDRNIAVDRTMEYICNYISKKFTLYELANVACMSPRYFCTAFKQVSGVTPWEYITEKKIELAKELLCETHKSVIDIAFECGYSNAANFNRAFKKLTCMTPVEYRKASVSSIK